MSQGSKPRPQAGGVCARTGGSREHGLGQAHTQMSLGRTRRSGAEARGRRLDSLRAPMRTRQYRTITRAARGRSFEIVCKIGSGGV